MTRDKDLMTAIIYVGGKTCCRILYLMWNEKQHLAQSNGRPFRFKFR